RDNEVTKMAFIYNCGYVSYSHGYESVCHSLFRYYEGLAPLFNYSRYRVDGGGSILSVTDPVSHGRQSAKFLVPNDGNSWRAEVATNTLGYGSFSFSFSNYIPGDWEDSTFNTIVAQWHGYKLMNTYNTNPAIALSIENTRWMLKVHYLANPKDLKPKQRTYDMGPAEKNKWNQWNFQITWSRPDMDGTIKVALHDTIIAYDNGANNYHQVEAPYLKQGIYRPNWNPRKGSNYTTGGSPVIIYCDHMVVTKLD
ncbi:hypothetical protein QQS21_012140, partial [Conoideocrella luteorostrata]